MAEYVKDFFFKSKFVTRLRQRPTSFTHLTVEFSRSFSQSAVATCKNKSQNKKIVKSKKGNFFLSFEFYRSKNFTEFLSVTSRLPFIFLEVKLKEKKMGRKEGQRTKGNTKVRTMSHNLPSYYSNLLILKCS